jgi:hypothetical protein
MSFFSQLGLERTDSPCITRGNGPSGDSIGTNIHKEIQYEHDK